MHVVKEGCASYLCGENCIWSEKVVYIACMRINICEGEILPDTCLGVKARCDQRCASYHREVEIDVDSHKCINFMCEAEADVVSDRCTKYLHEGETDRLSNRCTNYLRQGEADQVSEECTS